MKLVIRIKKLLLSLTYQLFQINSYIDTVSAKFASVAASSVSIGKSYEQRDMKMITITKAGPGKQNIFIEAGNYFL
jgi:hypothetical protein